MKAKGRPQTEPTGVSLRIESQEVVSNKTRYRLQLRLAAASAPFALWILGPSPVWGQDAAAPKPTQPSPAALGQQVRRAEQWVHQIDGLRMRFEGKWERSPESIAARKGELQQQFPNANLTPERFEDLRMEQTETLEIVFDQHRFKLVNRRQGGGAREEAWDGHLAVQHFHSPTENAYSIEPRPYRLGRNLFADLS